MPRNSTPEAVETPATLTEGQALIAYAGKADEVKAAIADLTESEAALQPKRDLVAKLRSEIEPLIEAMGGADPLSVMKGASAGRKTGPRDPNRRKNVLAAMTGKTAAEIREATGEPNGYVQSVINAVRKSDELTVEGERGEFRFTYVPKS